MVQVWKRTHACSDTLTGRQQARKNKRPFFTHVELTTDGFKGDYMSYMSCVSNILFFPLLVFEVLPLFFFFLLFLALEIYGQFSMSDFHFSIWAKTVGSILISIVLGVGGSVVHKRIGAWPSLGKQTLNKHRQPITCDDSI